MGSSQPASHTSGRTTTSKSPPSCERRDGSDGWRSPVTLGDDTEVRGCADPPPTIAFWDCRQVPKFVTDVLWTVCELACLVLSDGCDVAASVLTCCRGSRISGTCRCGDFGFVSRHKPPEHRIPDVSATPDVGGLVPSNT